MKFYIIAAIAIALCISCKEKGPGSDRECKGRPSAEESGASDSAKEGKVPGKKSGMPGGFFEKPRLEVPEAK